MFNAREFLITLLLTLGVLGFSYVSVFGELGMMWTVEQVIAFMLGFLFCYGAVHLVLACRHSQE